MKKFIFLICILCGAEIGYSFQKDNTFNLNPSQTSQNGFDKKRLLLGPGIGAGAAYRAFSFDISPTLGYAFHENFNAGVTLGFNYFQQAEDYTNPINGQLETFKHKYPGYSLSVYARYLFKNFLMINFEPELNNVKYLKSFDFNMTTGKYSESYYRKTIPSALVGVGYMQRFGSYGYSFISINYDLIQNPNSRYYQTLSYQFGVMIPIFN
ncbi:MAG: hypothetical protein IT215_09615 [Chitinophagaceae bacterium]|nr:hypothetical protein [Chitinophagaceae bacterium]HMN32243.1 hypothetical protein [Chitinophagaceae bacterium]